MARGLFAGIITIDIQFLADHYPASNSKVKAKNNLVSIGGPATNAAVTFSHLGGKTHLLTSIGNHQFTTMMTDELKTYNVLFSDINPRCTAKPTFASIITSAENGDRTVFSYHPENISTIDMHLLEEINLDDYDFVFVDGFFMDFALRLTEKAIDAGIPVIFDGGSWKKGTEKLLHNITIAICSNNFHPPGKPTAEETLRFLYTHPNMQHAAITRGEEPIVLLWEDKPGFLTVKETHVIDTLGAGDIFHGAFCYHYMESYDFEFSLKQASIIAAKSCNFFGTREWMEHV
jgi:sugar/nucleoside kinase (ribokinase family)